jgi:hypothetical protein
MMLFIHGKITKIVNIMKSKLRYFTLSPVQKQRHVSIDVPEAHFLLGLFSCARTCLYS